MKRKINIKATFRQLKNLPLEVSFPEVKSWILQQEIRSAKANRWAGLFLQKYFRRSEN